MSAPEVAVVGVGLHPFGRYGDKLCLQMGAEAAQAALADAGAQWSDVQVAAVGSYEVSNPDAIVSWLGLTGIPVRGVFNGSITPEAWRRTAMTAEEILASEIVNYPLTRYMYCNPDEGAAAVVLCRADIARRFTSTPIYLRAAELRSRTEGAFEVQSPSLPTTVAPSPTVHASAAAFEAAGIGPQDVDVAQLQDTDAGSEVIHMAENGFCADGEQEKWIAEGATEIGGRLPVNTDGGLIANGEPIGASGLRQIRELVLQLRGQAGDRQVAGNPRGGD